MYKLTDIRHETHDFWILDCHDKGFEVYRKGCTHSTRCATIGRFPDGSELTRAIAECERRQTELESKE